MPRVVKSVPIMLDKERSIRYDMAAMEKFEELTGASFSVGFQIANLTAKNIKLLMWVGLLHEDPEITQETVSHMFGFADLVEIIPLITQAISNAAPKPKETASPNAQEGP